MTNRAQRVPLASAASQARLDRRSREASPCGMPAAEGVEGDRTECRADALPALPPRRQGKIDGGRPHGDGKDARD